MTKQRKDFAEQVSVLLRQGKSRTEICKIIKRDKGWLSKLIKEMRSEYPELLKETAEAPKEPSNNPIQAQKEQERTETQMLSFRANIGDIKRWKIYAKVKKMTATELYSYAINEYIKNHPLSEKEKKAFDILMELES